MSRVTFAYVNNMVQGNLQNNSSRVADLQEKLSSGKRIQRPSDAPVDATNDLELRADLGSMRQWKRNGEDGSSYLAVIDSTLTQSANIFQTARERAVQGATDTLTARDRQYIAKDVREAVLNQMLSVANTTYKGDYSFSGHRIDLPPYTLREASATLTPAANPNDPNAQTIAAVPATLQLWDENFPAGEQDAATTTGYPQAFRIIPGTVSIPGLTEGPTADYTLDYTTGQITLLSANALASVNGPTGAKVDYEWIRHAEDSVDVDIQGDIFRQTDKGTAMKVNVNAHDVFGDPRQGQEDSFTSIIKLLEGLHENDGAAVNASIKGLDDGLQRFLNSAATVGSKSNRVDMSLAHLEDRSIETQRIQSEIEDLDFAEAISEFTLAQAVLEASLNSAAKVLQPTLANYL